MNKINEIEKNVIRLAEHIKSPIYFVDIGSRNGILELANLSKFTHAFGFEPNAEEYKKIIENRTDLYTIVGLRSPEYKNIEYLPYAISNSDGEQEFYITKGPGACGLLKPNRDRLDEIIWKGRYFQNGFGKDVFEIVRKEKVKTKTVKSFCEEKNISYIDYLKIDVEGTEYEVLEGCGDLLKNIGVIKTEITFIPFRENQKLFSHIDLLLREFGYDLLGFETQQLQVGYKERKTPIDYGPSVGYPDRYGQILHADAIYVNRLLKDPDRLMAQTAVLIEKKFFDEALFILRRKIGFSDKTIEEWLENTSYHYMDANAEYGGRILILYGIYKKMFDFVRKCFQRISNREKSVAA